MKPDDDGLFPEQKLFNKLVDYGEIFLDKGIAHLWFSWIEWVGLTALLFIAFDKADSVVALIAGIFSIFVLFFVALASIRKIFAFYLVKDKQNKWAIFAAAVLVFTGPMLAFSLIASVLEAAGV
jgi:hypothetical protein